MVQPIGNRLLVKTVKATETTTTTGFIIKDDPEVMGSVKVEIVQVGADCTRAWNPGDIALTIKQAMTQAKDSPLDETTIISEDDVLGVIVPSA